jgi:general stress protein YciG
MNGSDEPPEPAGLRGFARLSPEQRKAVAAAGGASVPAEKRSFSANRNLAKEAGRLGGTMSRRLGKSASPTRQGQSDV